MYRHRLLLGIVLLAGLLIAMVPMMSRGADPSAQELYQLGMDQYAKGDLTTAKATLLKLVESGSAQLTKEERVNLFKTIQDIDRQAQSKLSPAELLTQGDQAVKAGQLARAAALYQQAQASATATDAEKQQAAAKLAQVQGQLQPETASVRQTLDAAQADVDAGRLTEAEKSLTDLKAKGVQLTAADAQRYDALTQKIAQAKAAAAVPAAPVAEAPKAEAPVAEAPKAEAPKAEAPKVETPVVEAPKAETPKTEAPAKDDLLTQAKRLVAQQKLAEGKAAEQQDNLRVAAKLYQEGLAADKDNKDLQTALQLVNAKLSQPKNPQAEPLDVFVSNRTVEAEAARAEFKSTLDSAKQRLAEKNFLAANDAVARAKLTLDRKQAILPPADYDKLRQEASTLSASIATAQRQFEQKQMEVDRTQQEREQAVQRQKVLAETDAEVQKLLLRARQLQKEQKYEQAKAYVNQALFLDPNNPTAMLMRDVIEDTAAIIEYRQLDREKARGIVDLSVDNQRALVPHSELIVYPTNWPEITLRRKKGLGQDVSESEVNRRVAQALAQPINRIEFDRNRLLNVIDFLRNTTNLNFFVNWAALQQIGVDQDKPISLQLQGIPAEQALRLVLHQASTDDNNPVTYSIVEGVVTISSQRDLTRTTDTRVYDIRDLLVNVPNYNNAPQFDLSSSLESRSTGGTGGGSSSGNGIFGSAGSGAAGSTGPTVKSREDLVRDITNLIMDSVGTGQDWVERGGTVSSLRELNGNLIVKTTADNHRSLYNLLSQLREARAMQISVEGRFLLVDQNVLDEVGLDIDVQWSPGGGWTPIQFNQDSFTMAQRQNTGVPGSFATTGGGGTFSDSSGGSSSGSTGSFAYALQVPSFSYIADDLQINAMLHATKARRSAISLTAPRITFFNGQRAYVMVATQISYISELEAVADANAFNPTLSVVSSGVVLSVEGTISADRRYVTMSVEPSLARVARIRQIPFFGATNINTNNNNNNNNNNNATSAVFTGTLEAPELEITQVRTTVSVPDRGTLLLGGQRLVGEVEIESGVPVLSQIPVINRFFTNTSTVRDERTLLILIKPTIIIQNEEEENLYPGLQADPGRYNVGRGMAPANGVSARGNP